MKVNIISESEYFEKDHGVHTAYINHLAMAKKKGLEVVTNYYGSADITHIHTVGPFGYYKLMTSKPCVVSAHLIPDSFVGSLRGTEYWLGTARKYLESFYNNADLVLAVGPLVKEQLEQLGVNRRIEILPNPVDSEMFRRDEQLRKSGRKILKIKDSEFVVLGVGQVQPRKGVADFIELANKNPEATFVWVGGKPFKTFTAEDDRTAELLENPPANFFLKGQFAYSDMPKIFNAADIFLFPSLQETGGMVIVEAAACGLPLIVRDNMEYKSLYKKGFIACKNISQFAKAVDTFVKNKSVLKKAQAESFDLASRFTIDVLGDTLIRYYKSLI